MVATRIQTDPPETIRDNFLKIQFFNAFVNKPRKVITGLVIIVHCPSVCPHRRARLYEWKHFVCSSSSLPCVLRTLSIAPYITLIKFGEYIPCNTPGCLLLAPLYIQLLSTASFYQIPRICVPALQICHNLCCINHLSLRYMHHFM
jgi:hypothetical protein